MNTIVTFYSYKGGVGRTMALANIAVILAKRGMRVLMVDFDLEAPGLHHYFRDFLPESMAKQQGVLELLGKNKIPHSLDQYSVKVNIPDAKSLTLITGGAYNEGYNKRVLAFDWVNFFEKQNGGDRIEALRELWLNEFDITLIDSRTGITDSGGVCTIQLPDILIPVLIANQQSLDGTTNVIHRVQKAREHFDWDRTPATILPLISRFDSRAEFDEGQAWLTKISETLFESYGDWLPKTMNPRRILERTKIPYVAKFAYGEKLAILQSSSTDQEGLAYSYETISALLFHDFRSAEDVVMQRDNYVNDMDKGFVKKFKWDIFLSYPKNAEALSNRILQELQKVGFRTWTQSEIKPGENLEESIQIGMANSSIISILITPDTNSSKWQLYEIENAMKLQNKSRNRLTIIPIFSGQVSTNQLPTDLMNIQGVTLQGYKDLRALIRIFKETRRGFDENIRFRHAEPPFLPSIIFFWGKLKIFAKKHPIFILLGSIILSIIFGVILREKILESFKGLLIFILSLFNRL